jgi:hypothetical protein
VGQITAMVEGSWRHALARLSGIPWQIAPFFVDAMFVDTVVEVVIRGRRRFDGTRRPRARSGAIRSAGFPGGFAGTRKGAGLH